jgi:hypothetical protein
MDFYKLGSAHALEKLALGSLARTLLGGGVGAGLGAIGGELTDVGAGTGALVGAGAGGLGGRFSKQIAELAARSGSKATEKLEPLKEYLSGVRGRVEQAGKNLKNVTTGQPREMGPAEWLQANWKSPHYAAVHNRLAQLEHNPELWKQFLEERGLSAIPSAPTGKTIIF